MTILTADIYYHPNPVGSSSNTVSIFVHHVSSLISDTTDVIEVVFMKRSYEFFANPNYKIVKLGYDDIKDVPLQKTYVLNNTPTSYTLTSANHTAQESPLSDVWQQEISETLRTGLSLIVDSCSELNNLPTDYTQAIEIPSNIMQFEIFLNGSASALNITPCIFKNMVDSYVIIFKYQDLHYIGDLDLSTGYITFNEDYINSSSPIGINVTSVKYDITNSQIV